MTRKKATLAFIASNSARRATFAKRKKGLIKKAKELSTLCGVEACAIVNSPHENNAVVWPESQNGVKGVLDRFENLPELKQTEHMLDQESYLEQQKVKMGKQLRKLQIENREKEMKCVMFRNLSENGTGGHDLEMVDLIDLGFLIDRTLKEIDQRISGPPNEAVMEPNNAVLTLPAAGAANPINDENIMNQ